MEKLKRVMKVFSNSHIDNLERNMMRGMFLRKLKDFAEQQKENHENMSLIDRMQKDRDKEEKSEEFSEEGISKESSAKS
jgi:hypothetical protein